MNISATRMQPSSRLLITAAASAAVWFTAAVRAAEARVPSQRGSRREIAGSVVVIVGELDQHRDRVADRIGVVEEYRCLCGEGIGLGEEVVELVREDRMALATLGSNGDHLPR